MSTHVRLAFLALLSLGLLTQSATAEDGPGAKGGAAPAAPAKAKEDVKPGAVAVVKLLSNGAEPRSVLRYAPGAGSKLDFSTSSTNDMSSPMGEMRVGPIKNTMRVDFAKGAKKGEYAVAIEMTDASLEADASNPFAANMKTGIEAVKGAKISGILSDTGVFKASVLEGTPHLGRDTLLSQVVALFPPLPTEAVGVGAKWTTTVRIVANKVGQTAVVTAEITAIKGSRVDLKFTEARAAKDEKMSMMGQEVPVKEISGKGSGSIQIDLARGGVVKSTSKIDVTMKMEMMGQEMETGSSISSSLSSKIPAAVTEPAKTKPGK